MRSVHSTALRQLRVPSWRPRHIPSKGRASCLRFYQRLAIPLAQKLLVGMVGLGLAACGRCLRGQADQCAKPQNSGILLAACKMRRSSTTPCGLLRYEPLRSCREYKDRCETRLCCREQALCLVIIRGVWIDLRDPCTSPAYSLSPVVLH